MTKFLAITLLAALAIPVRAEEKADPKPVKIPFILTGSGHFIVKTMVNGKGPFNLIFDTGAPTMLVTNKLAKDAGLTAKKASGGLFSMGAPAQVAKKFEMGDLLAENISMMVFDHPTVRAFSEHYKKDHGSIEGIVGFPFFARYKMIVDYQAKELTLTPNGYKPGDVMEALMAKMMGGKDQGKPKIAAPASLLGLIVEKAAKDEEDGVTVSKVVADSPAAKAGIKEGDRLLTIGNRWTDSIADTYTAASHARPGKETPVTVKRDGKEVKLTVVPANGL